jgi:hypothetical protein
VNPNAAKNAERKPNKSDDPGEVELGPGRLPDTIGEANNGVMLSSLHA